MKILIIDNGIMSKQDDIYYTVLPNEKFLSDLSKKSSDKILFMQFVDENSNNSLKIYSKITEDEVIKVVPLKWYGTHFYEKIYSYVLSIIPIIKILLASDFIYAFFPGHLSKISLICALLLKKQYGIYLRGEKGIKKSQVSRMIIQNAKFVITISSLIKEWISPINKKVSQIKPMSCIKNTDIITRTDYIQKKIWKLLFVGRIEKRKGIDELFEIANILTRKYHINYELILIGGHDEKTYNIEINEEIRRNITFIGIISNQLELKKYYMESDLFIFPSHDEGFPRVLYEAMAYGTPIVTTFVGGIPGMMKDDYNCKRIPLKKPEEQTKIIVNLLNNLEKRKLLANNATKDIQEFYKLSLLEHSDEVYLRIKEYLECEKIDIRENVFNKSY